MHLSTLFAAASASLLFSGIAATPAAEPVSSLSKRVGLLRRDDLEDAPTGDRDDDDGDEIYLLDDDEHHREAEMEKVFGIIEQIPDDVLERGDGEKNKWLAEHGYTKSTDDDDDDDDDGDDGETVETRDIKKRGTFACILEVGQLIVETAIPAAKLLKIKRLVRALGGVRRAARLVYMAKGLKNAAKIGGKALRDLVDIILGISDVRRACNF